MLDPLRDQASQPPFHPQEQIPPLEEPHFVTPKRRSGLFLGMTPQQRFILTFMLFVLVCVLGSMFLLITGKIVPPFFY